MRFAFLALTSALLSAPAFAADLGTYRPGTPYHSTQVPGADVCASTCSGDAQCQGWNFVKPNPQAPGVCELQSQVGAPVSSAISISGVSGSRSATRSNVVQGKTNTIRVGTAPMARPVQAQTATPSGRRVVRQPVPQPRRTVQPAAHQAMRARRPVPGLAPQQPMQRRMPAPAQPRFQPMLDGQPTARAPQSHPAQPNMMAPGPRPVAPRGPVRRRDARMAPQQPATPLAQGRPPVGQPIAPQAMAQRPATQAPTSMPTRSAAQPLTFNQAQNSLFGSLHDDVQAPAANVPVPSDPNAPIPTSQSRPVAPVGQEQLAGAIRR